MLRLSIASLGCRTSTSSRSSLFPLSTAPKWNVRLMFLSYYNKTSFSGLETHITNSYLNPLLQILKFTPLVRNLALEHAASECLSQVCLLCEMGYLFDMLEKAAGQSCQATNFFKTLGSTPDGTKSLATWKYRVDRFDSYKITDPGGTRTPKQSGF